MEARVENRATHRLALGAAFVATVWFALAACWEIDAPFGAGHYAASTAVATAGENMWRWRIVAPVTTITQGAPSPADVYCHHPWVIFWTAALFAKLFGHHAWVVRLPAVLASAATPPALYALGTALWGPVAGAIAACGFVVLPIALAFADFHSLEVTTILALVLFALGLVRLRQSPSRRTWGLTLASLSCALNADWPAFVFAAVAIAVGAARALRSRENEERRRLDLRVTAAIAAACVVIGGAYLLAFRHYGHLDEFHAQARLRSGGASTSIRQILAERRTWIELSFTPIAILIGKLALPLVAVRAVLRRDRDEWIVIAFFVTATFQYLVFKEAADIHVFWPHYFAAYFALALGACAASFESVVHRVLERRRPRLVRLAGAFSLGLFVITVATIAPDGLRVLRFAHATGGRFNEHNGRIASGLDQTAALAFAATRMPTDEPVAVDHTMRAHYAFEWVVQRPVRRGSAPIHDQPGERYFLTDSRFASSWVLAALAQRYAVVAIGPYWFVDTMRTGAPIEAHAIAAWIPDGSARFLTAGSHPRYRIEPDPFATWELRAHFAQEPNPAPTVEPSTLDSIRIAHNIAVATGDSAAATRYLARLVSSLDRSSACTTGDGAHQLGTSLSAAGDTLSVFFLATRPLSPLVGLDITGVETRSPRASWLDVDPGARAVGVPPAIPPRLWRRGFIYATRSEVLRRPGTERWVGRWRGLPTDSLGDCATPRTLVILAGS